ncbi:sugar ABC transporter permease [Microbacterium sp. BK668]|uniref:ABC transporter permease n=1 Tax=Microbacterium sp. BK668 TaxID=2512118 RepID=UPI00105FA95E|nr:sugar ABC transporter permease [Microbacterium sp. BK668]TDN91739.1 monosaccharide ABC transporter membrane protein (CUT2 family) [Microbacterium sp. BK668]
MSARTLAESVPPVADLPESRQPRQVKRFSGLWERSQTLIPTLAALVLLFGMLIYAEVAYGRVFHAGTMSTLLVSFAPTIILAVGMTIVIVSGGIDLSVGAVVAFSSVAGVMLMNIGINGWLSMLLMIGFGALFGLISGVMIQYFNVQPFIATLAMMFLARGLASILSTTPVVVAEDSPLLLLATDWKIIDGPKVNDFTITPGLLIAVLVVLGGIFFMHRTRMGRTVYAIGGNESSAQLMGLPVARTRVWIYVVSGALAGLAAIVYTAEVGGKAQNVTGIGWELDAIAAVVIGGTLLTGGYGYVLGSIVGVFVLAALRLIITKDGTINPEYLTIITGAVLLVFVLLQRVLTRRRAD